MARIDHRGGAERPVAENLWPRLANLTPRLSRIRGLVQQPPARCPPVPGVDKRKVAQLDWIGGQADRAPRCAAVKGGEYAGSAERIDDHRYDARPRRKH